MDPSSVWDRCSFKGQASAPPRLAFGSKLWRESDARIRRIGCRWNLWHVVLYAGYSSGAANEPHGITLLSVLSSGIGARGAVGESSASVEAQSVVDSEAVSILLAEARHAIMEARKVQVQLERVTATKSPLCLMLINMSRYLYETKLMSFALAPNG